MSLVETFDHYATPVGPELTPYRYFEALRDEAIDGGKPIGWSEAYGGFWVVCGWPESRAIHEDLKNFSNVATTFPPYATPSGKPFFLSGQDEPEHSFYRSIVQSPFTKPKARQMLDAMRDIANLAIDTIGDARSVDVCQATDLMPGYAFCAIAGLSMDDAPKFRRYVAAMVEGAIDPEKAAPDLREMEEFWRAMVKRRRETPGDGLLDRIISSEFHGRYLSEDELLEFFTVLLLGGFDNTLRFLANSFFRLAGDADLRRTLVQNPDKIGKAVDEFLRLDGPACTFRLVRAPVAVGGVEMKAGDIVGLIHPVCNRDPRQFDEPDRFVIDRAPNRHLAFGIGIHHCLGAYLAHSEAVAMIEEFLRRIPEFTLDPDRPARWVPGQVGGMHTVPILF